MPVIEKHWEKLTEEKWQHLAEQYLSEIRRNIGREGRDEDVGTEEFRKAHKWGVIITRLGMWSPPELLWRFILRLIPMAETDEELGQIAAGEIEYLLGRAGEEYIDLVEQEAKTNPKFSRTITGCLQYMMTDEVWARVQKLQAQVEDALLKVNKK